MAINVQGFSNSHSGSGTVTQVSGVGVYQAVPAPTANGALLGVKPTGTTKARFLLGNGDSVTYQLSAAAPGSPPSNTITISGQDSRDWVEPLFNLDIYVVSKSGSPSFRYL